MDILVICLAAFAASTLTLFSGFGLGTLLMPVIAIFVALPHAIAITALVHLANNLFKFSLLAQYARRDIVIRFGLPAMLCALVGASVLTVLSALPTLHSYVLWQRQFHITPIKFFIGSIILIFVVIELSPRLAALQFGRGALPLGGALSGFFGGLSGHQGALRSMFLIRSGLDKQAFIATNVVIAVLVDVARLAVYGLDVAGDIRRVDWALVAAASLAAFAGAFCGARMIRKVTITLIRRLVSALLVIVAAGMMVGAI